MAAAFCQDDRPEVQLGPRLATQGSGSGCGRFSGCFCRFFNLLTETYLFCLSRRIPHARFLFSAHSFCTLGLTALYTPRWPTHPPPHQIKEQYPFIKVYHNAWPVYILIRQFLTNHRQYIAKKARIAAEAAAAANVGPSTAGPSTATSGNNGDQDDNDSDITSDDDDDDENGSGDSE